MTKTRPDSETTFHVIAAADFSELGDRAIIDALRQAKQHPKSEVHIISVAMHEDQGFRLPWESLSQLFSRVDAEESIRARVAALIAPEAPLSQSVQQISAYLTTGNPTDRIVQLATHIDADLIVIGTHSRKGISGLVLGSVADAVVRRAPCGVLVVRPRDFLAGHKVPPIDPELKPDEHALKPFYRAPTHHYVDRAAAASSRMFTTW